jgi:hypothetical protein
MTMYRTAWLSACNGLLPIAVGPAAHLSPEALPPAFVVVAVACSSVGSVRMRGSTRQPRVRARFVATSALIGGTIAVATVGFTSLLEPRVGLLALFVLHSSPPAVRAYGRWLRSVPTPSATQLDAIARAFAHARTGYVGVQPETAIWTSSNADTPVRSQPG